MVYTYLYYEALVYTCIVFKIFKYLYEIENSEIVLSVLKMCLYYCIVMH